MNAAQPVVLVSHAMMEVEQFCQQVILLNRGQVLFQGGASEAVKRYYLIDQQERLLGIGHSNVTPSAEATLVPADHSDEFWPSTESFLDISHAAQVANGWARCTAIAVCDSQRRPCHVFQQGERASFFYEFELQHDIDAPIGGLIIHNEKGLIVHGKNTLHYGTEIPLRVHSGSLLRFHQEVNLEIAPGEYVFEVGLAALGLPDYERRRFYSHQEVESKQLRLCQVPSAATFTVILRHKGEPTQLLHHGVANLPGSCQVAIIAAPDQFTSVG